MAKKRARAKTPRSQLEAWNQQLAGELRLLKRQILGCENTIKANGEHLIAEVWVRDAATAMLRGLSVQVRRAEEMALEIAAYTGDSAHG